MGGEGNEQHTHTQKHTSSVLGGIPSGDTRRRHKEEKRTTSSKNDGSDFDVCSNFIDDESRDGRKVMPAPLFRGRRGESEWRVGFFSFQVIKRMREQEEKNELTQNIMKDQIGRKRATELHFDIVCEIENGCLSPTTSRT